MLTTVDYKFRYDYDNGKCLGTYIDFIDRESGSVYYTMTQVNEQDFYKYLKKYGENLLTELIDAAFDGSCINYFDIDNDFDKFKCPTCIEGHYVEIPMILFKITDYCPACASVYYVNNRVIERYEQGLFLHT